MCLTACVERQYQSRALRALLLNMLDVDVSGQMLAKPLPVLLVGSTSFFFTFQIAESHWVSH